MADFSRFNILLPLRARRISLRSRAALMLAATAPMAGFAASPVYIGPTGNWSTQGNWSTGAAPGVGDDVQLIQNGPIDTIVTFDSTAPNTNFASLITDNTGLQGAMIFTQTESLLTTVSEQVGVWGLGTLNLNGGTHEVTGAGFAGLVVGSNGGSIGTVNLNAGSLNIRGSAYIGFDGTGVMNVNGGTHNIFGAGTNGLFVGYDFGGVGTLNINDGVFNEADTLSVGAGGNGTVNQIGGQHFLNGYLVLGGQVGPSIAGTGAYNFADGVLTAHTLYVGLSGNGNYSQSNGTALFGLVSVGYLPGSFGVATMGGGSMFTRGSETYGDQGTGQFIQAGGDHSNSGLYLGNNVSGVGTLTMTGGTLDVEGIEIIGNLGSGEMDQSSGVHTAVAIYAGLQAGSSSSLSLSGNGSLTILGRPIPGGFGTYYTAPDEYLGYYGSSTFTQLGGTHTVNGSLHLAQQTGAVAAYNLSGGLLNIGNAEVIGSLGQATFNQSGGTHSTGTFYAGLGTGSSGNVTISGGAMYVSGIPNVSQPGTYFLQPDEYLGYSGTATLTQTGGLHQVGGYLYLGHEPSSSANYNLISGTVRTAFLTVGYQSQNATFTQSGGLNSDPYGSTNNTVVFLGYTNGGHGTYNLQNGTLTADTLWSGYYGQGDFNQSGGTANLRVLVAGYQGSSVGNVSMSGGTLNVSYVEVIGSHSVGTFTQTGGTHVFTGVDITINADAAKATGVYNLYGGTLSATRVVNLGTFNVDNATAAIGPFTGSGAGNLNIGLGGTAKVTVSYLDQNNVNVSGAVLNIGTNQNAAIPWGPNGAMITPGSTIKTLTVTNGGTVAFSQTVGTGNPFLYPSFTGTFGTRLTHSVGTLVMPYSTNGSAASFARGGDGSGTISPAGTLDIGNHQVLLNTPTAASVQNVKMLIAAGFNASAYGNEDGAWDGNGITSSVARSSYDPNALASKYVVAYAYGNDQSVQLEQGGGASGNNFSLDGLGTNQTLVRAVLLGDVNMDGAVDFNDIGQVLGFTYNQNIQSHYTDGDIANHGIVNFDDIGLILAYNFNSGLNFPGQTAAQAQAKASVFKSTAAAVRRSAIHAAAVAGKPDFTYDPASGDLKFVLNGFTPLQLNGAPSFVDAISITSANGLLVPGAASDGFAGGVGATLSTNLLAAAMTNGPGFGDGLGTLTYDLGNVLPTGLSLLDVQSDLTLRYQVMNDGLLQATGLSSAVPEPAGLAMLGLGAVGLLGRRKRSLKSPS